MDGEVDARGDSLEAETRERTESTTDEGMAEGADMSLLPVSVGLAAGSLDEGTGSLRAAQLTAWRRGNSGRRHSGLSSRT